MSECEYCGEGAQNTVNGTSICNDCYDSFEVCDKCKELTHIDDLKLKWVNKEHGYSRGHLEGAYCPDCF